MKAHFFYSGLLATLITAGCGTESSEPELTSVAPPASTPSTPAPATPQPATSASVSTTVATNAMAEQAQVAEIGPVDLTPKLDIFRSAGSGDIDAVKYHLRNGVKPNDRDKTGKTALLWAIRSKKHEVVYHLLDRGADPNVADQNKVTPLFWAVRMRRPELVSALLNKGARIKALDARGKDVFDYAKDDTIIEILRNHANK